VTEELPLKNVGRLLLVCIGSAGTLIGTLAGGLTTYWLVKDRTVREIETKVTEKLTNERRISRLEEQSKNQAASIQAIEQRLLARSSGD